MLNRIALCVLAIALVAPVGAAAQTPLGSLTGTVRDSQNAVLPGATVQLRNTATGAKQTTMSNDIGVFAFSQLPAGTYQVRVSFQGFRTQTYNDVAVNVGQDYALPVQLAVGGVTEMVEVTAGRAAWSRRRRRKSRRRSCSSRSWIFRWPAVTSRT